MTSNESLQLPRKYCILCVDDDLIGLELRAALLETEGYSVTAVSCPLMALEHDVSKFHMAILDFALPVLNGFQLLLRRRAARASFPIVLLSGMSRNLPNDIRSAFSSCLDKGEPIHLLLNTVRSYLTSIPGTPVDPRSKSALIKGQREMAPMAVLTRHDEVKPSGTLHNHKEKHDDSYSQGNR